MRELVVALACFLLTESIPATPPSEPQALVGDDTEAYGSTLTADLTFDNPRSPAGWGSLDFSAAPERDEVRVDVVVGTPAPERRFTCGELNVVIDGVAETVSASELAVPTNDGFFDASATTSATTLSAILVTAPPERQASSRHPRARSA